MNAQDACRQLPTHLAQIYLTELDTNGDHEFVPLRSTTFQECILKSINPFASTYPLEFWVLIANERFTAASKMLEKDKTLLPES